ncbi:MAG: cation-translocating P-type ATPase [Candidatus Bathyarchaeota archaeon]|nr:MAG: cation-translocating P-type ATPase [Candidatus Bathyarchaeota archaeon]
MIGLSGALFGTIFIGHSALKSLSQGEFGIDLLATVAILASIWVGEYLAAAIVALMLGGGEVLEGYAFNRASEAIDKLIHGFPQTATVRRNGHDIKVEISAVGVGETVIIKPGGIIPVDGRVLAGHATVNQASVTGESLPVEKMSGDDVFSGSLVTLGALEVRVTAVGGESMYGRIVSMVREAQELHAPIVQLADKFARYYIPLILVIGVLVYVIFQDPLRMAAVFIIACPCALTLATPTAIVASIGNSARQGILIRNGENLERLGTVNTLILDKTGTITTGDPYVSAVKGWKDVSSTEVLQVASGAETHSEHPLAKAILTKAEDEGIEPLHCSNFEVYPGLGICVTEGNKLIRVGSEKMMKEHSIPLSDEILVHADPQDVSSTTMYVARDDEIIGWLQVSDVLRQDVLLVLKNVKRSGAEKVIMLTGDRQTVAEEIGKDVGFDDIIGDMLPSEKVQYIQQLQSDGGKVMMVGDGINDAPALATSDVGVAMGLTGTDIAIETAGITLTSNNLAKIPALFRIGRATMNVIKLNILFAIVVNVVGIILSMFGVISPLVASIIHESNAVVVMVNALRLLRIK